MKHYQPEVQVLLLMLMTANILIVAPDRLMNCAGGVFLLLALKQLREL